MTGDLSKLSAALEELVREPAPPMVLDVARARKAGRRTLTRRRTFGWLGSPVAVALVAGVIIMAMPRQTGAPDSAVTSTGGHPLIAKASFGWLPDWYAGVGYGAGAHGDYAVARAVSRGPGDLHPYAWLSVSRDANPPKQSPRGVGQYTVPAEPVNGRPAYWVTDNEADPTNGGDYFLRWQVSADLWAELRAYYLPVNDARDTLLQIAADVTVADRPVPVPVRITDLPADFQFNEATLNRPPVTGTGAWEFSLSYLVNGQSVGVSAYPAGTAELKSDNSACTTADGVDVCVSMMPAVGDRPVPPALAAIGGMRGLLDRITVLGMDERNWTTRLYG